MKPATPEAYKLLHDGAIALSRIESNGMRIDVAYLQEALKKTGQRIERLRSSLEASDTWKLWKEKYKGDANLGSTEQLGVILFEVMDFPCYNRTPTGKPKTDEKELRRIDIPFVRKYLSLKKAGNLQGTFLMGIQRELVGEYIHPVFNLHTTRTYRSSSNTPNFQNLPRHDASMSRLVRSCFIPRRGHVLAEIDYGGLEICSSACYHKDPRMIRYIADDSRDLHRDMAAECYLLTPKNVSYDIRDCAKNMFVFPQFYGDYYGACARSLWRAVKERKLMCADGVSLRDHLASKGITKLGRCDFDTEAEPGTFASHIKGVEHKFWHKRFKIYNEWKVDWYEAYKRAGSFMLLSGFLIQGYLRRNEVINYPAQGTGFHFLLWSLIRLEAWLRKRKMRSVVIGQIHDSIVADVHESELPRFLRKAERIMTEDIRVAWPWINVPLSVDASVTAPGAPWYEKEEMAIV